MAQQMHRLPGSLPQELAVNVKVLLQTLPGLSECECLKKGVVAVAAVFIRICLSLPSLETRVGFQRQD